MFSSRTLKKLRNGEAVSCFKLNLSDGRSAEIAAIAGFDCLWADMEHVPNDWTEIQAQIWAAKSHGVDMMIRVARGCYSDYIKPLELDAAGIMVPHVMSLEDAKSVVQMTRFHPIGRRPVDGGNADGAYCDIDMIDYMRLSNEQKFVVIQIEDPEPLEDLDEIASLDGIDMLFFGPTDFSQGIGVPGDWNNNLITETRKKVVEAAVKHGKFAGTVGSIDNFNELLDMGYRFINLGADVRGLSIYCKSLVKEFSKGV